MNVLLLGGNGMLGKAILDRRRELDSSLNFCAPRRSELDLLNTDAVREYLRARDFDLIIHCAAKVGGIQANIGDPTAFLFENTILGLNVVRGAAETGVKRLMYIGSSCMYPRNYKNPLLEEYLLAAPLEPTNEGYALAKLVSAKLCEYYERQFGLSYKTIIPCNLFGPNDHFDAANSHMVPAVIRKLDHARRIGSDQVEIWGDGTARREFLFVNDLAGFIVRTVESFEELPSYLNVGFGSDFTVLEYYQMIREVVGFKGGFTFDLTKPAGMQQKLLDSTRAHRIGWKPETPMHIALSRTYEYFLRDVRKVL